MQLPIKTVLSTSDLIEKQNKIFSSAAANGMENAYELEENIDSEKRMRQSQAVKLPKQTVWTAPFTIVIVLLCLMLILHLIILCFIVVNTATSCLSSTTTGSTAESITPLNFTEWSDAIASKVNTDVTQSLPNFNEWSDDVVNKVNANVTQSLPNFNEWSDDVVNKVNANVTQSLPNFNEWSDDVVNKVNASVTQSLPNFNEWSDDVVNKVNANVTQSLPNFNEWSDDVVNKVNANVTQSLPNFNEWSDDVVNKVNANVTQSLPNFNEWSDDVVNKVNANVTQSLPNFNEWSDDVVNKVNANVTQSLPNFNEWSDDVVNKVNASVTQSLPNFNEWSDDVVNKVNANVTQSLPNFNEWSDGVTHNTFRLLQNHTNFTQLDHQILQTTTDSAQKLMNMVNTLSALQDTSTSTARVTNNILLVVQKLMQLHNGSTGLPTSCKEIKERHPLSLSGVYVLENTSTTYIAYCNMDTLCGSEEGWTRLAYLDMSDATQNCPSGLQYFSSSGLRTCGKKNTQGASCDSVQFPSHGIRYSQVCGKAVGYQYGTPDAVHPSRNIDSVYIDGVSITHGSPRQHIWSLMVGVHSNKSYYDNCPCAGGTTPQSFVGNDYFCESANPTDSWDPVFYSTDPLWDGKGCDAAEASCCSDPRLPWFNKTLGAPTTDYLEMRLCVDQGTHTEDIKLTSYEIYVQ